MSDSNMLTYNLTIKSTTATTRETDKTRMPQ